MKTVRKLLPSGCDQRLQERKKSRQRGTRFTWKAKCRAKGEEVPWTMQSSRRVVMMNQYAFDPFLPSSLLSCPLLTNNPRVPPEPKPAILSTRNPTSNNNPTPVPKHKDLPSPRQNPTTFHPLQPPSSIAVVLSASKFKKHILPLHWRPKTLCLASQKRSSYNKERRCRV